MERIRGLGWAGQLPKNLSVRAFNLDGCYVVTICVTYNIISQDKTSCSFTLVSLEVRAQCPVWLLSVVPCLALQLCSSDIFCMILIWFQLPLLLLVPVLFLCTTVISHT